MRGDIEENNSEYEPPTELPIEKETGDNDTNDNDDDQSDDDDDEEEDDNDL